MSTIPRHRVEVTAGAVVRSLFARNAVVEELRAALEHHFGGRVVFFASARSALFHLLKALPHPTVMMPAYTCKVVPEAALIAGKRIVYVDVGLDDFNMSLADLERKMVPGSVVLATHQFGLAADMGAVSGLAGRNRCTVVEDIAAAMGTRLGGRLAGTFGAAAVGSFENTKVVAAGRGGFAVVHDAELYDRLTRVIEDEPPARPPLSALSNAAMLGLYKIVAAPWVYTAFIRSYVRRRGVTGDSGAITPVRDRLYSSRLLPSQASMAFDNLRRIEGIISRRLDIAARYAAGLADLPGLHLPTLRPDTRPSLMRYPVRVDGLPKAAFHERCLARGLDLGFTYNYSCDPGCPDAVRAAKEVVNLPIYGSLREAEVGRVIRAVRGALA